MQNINDRILKVSSPTQQKAIFYLYKNINQRAFTTMEKLSKGSGISKGSFFPVLDLLEVGGVINTSNRGRIGIYIEIINQESFEYIGDKIEQTGILKIDS